MGEIKIIQKTINKISLSSSLLQQNSLNIFFQFILKCFATLIDQFIRDPNICRYKNKKSQPKCITLFLTTNHSSFLLLLIISLILCSTISSFSLASSCSYFLNLLISLISSLSFSIFSFKIFFSISKDCMSYLNNMGENILLVYRFMFFRIDCQQLIKVVFICCRACRRVYTESFPFESFYWSIYGSFLFRVLSLGYSSDSTRFLTLSSSFMNFQELTNGVYGTFNYSMQVKGFIDCICYSCYSFIIYATLPFSYVLSQSTQDRQSCRWLFQSIQLKGFLVYNERRLLLLVVDMICLQIFCIIGFFLNYYLKTFYKLSVQIYDIRDKYEPNSQKIFQFNVKAN